MSLELQEAYKKGELILSGKTKEIYEVEYEPSFVIMKNNDNISSGDGERIEKGEGKSEYSTTITSNVFEYLNNEGIKTHFLEKISSNEIMVEKCDMLPLECVFRFVATGSYISREQAIKGDEAIEDGTLLTLPIIELYYKYEVLTDEGEFISDPMIKIGENGLPEIDDTGKLCLLNPKTGEEFTYTATFKEGGKEQIIFSFLKKEALNIKQNAEELFKKTYDIGKLIKSFYGEVGIDIFDGKIEFGINGDNKIVLADVIDGDSCRLRVPYIIEGVDGQFYLSGDFLPGELSGKGGYSEKYFEKLETLPEGMKIKRVVLAEGLDKDGFRDGGDVDSTVKKYAILAEKSSEALSKSFDNNEDNIASETIEKIIEIIKKI